MHDYVRWTLKTYDDRHGRHALTLDSVLTGMRVTGPDDATKVDVSMLFDNPPFHPTRLPLGYKGRHVR